VTFARLLTALRTPAGETTDAGRTHSAAVYGGFTGWRRLRGEAPPPSQWELSAEKVVKIWRGAEAAHGTESWVLGGAQLRGQAKAGRVSVVPAGCVPGAVLYADWQAGQLRVRRLRLPRGRAQLARFHADKWWDARSTGVAMRLTDSHQSGHVTCAEIFGAEPSPWCVA